MRILKMFVIVIGLLFWATSTLPDTLRHLEGVGNMNHRLVKISEGMKEKLRKDPNWRICGDYFATKKRGEEKVVLFVFEKEPFTGGPSKGMVFAYTDIEGIDPSVSKDMIPSTVFVRDNWKERKFQIRMNVEDFKTGLPCFSKGTEI